MYNEKNNLESEILKHSDQEEETEKKIQRKSSSKKRSAKRKKREYIEYDKEILLDLIKEKIVSL